MKKINFDKLKQTFIIAEIGNNHEGNYDIAKKLIKLAAKAGVDAVKFQTFRVDDFINKEEKKRYNQLKKFQLSYNQFKNLKKIANKYNLKFMSTPLDYESSNFLLKNSDLIKIASSDNNFFPMIQNIIMKNKPLIISTGMLNFGEISYLIKKIVNKIGKKKVKEKIAILHCVTSYPVDNENANLNSINFLKKKFDLCIGYSDHTLGNEACLYAVSNGAKIIEKHFTIDKRFSKFRDHAMSANFEELREIVKSIRIIEKMKGSYQKEIGKCEVPFLKATRRMPYAKKDIKKGDRISFSNIRFLRSTKSKSFLDLENIIGKKIKNDVKKNQIIQNRNLK